jgi:tRNA modification GTPase
MASADRILLVVDDSDPATSDNPDAIWPERHQHLGRSIPVTIVHNKCDLTGQAPGVSVKRDNTVIILSAKTGSGMDLLREHLKECMGFQNEGEGNFSARRRHLQALEAAAGFLRAGQEQLLNAGAGELLAEDLRQSQASLGEITGALSSDELLGKIFSSFCIGK